MEVGFGATAQCAWSGGLHKKVDNNNKITDMIKEWKLDNFKSIDEEKDMEFRPLTIFTGANSSGKSTILQSILLVTQTLQSPIASRSILLNGWFKKFGSYTDIVNRRDYNKNIKIGFTLSNDATSREEMMYRYRFNENVRTVDCEFELSSDGNEECLQPLLRYTRLVTTKRNDKQDIKDVLDIQKSGERSPEEKSVIEKCKAKYQPSDFDYTINSKNKVRLGYYGADITDWKLIGAGMFHFLPHYAIGYTKYRDQLKRRLNDCLMLGRQSYFDDDEDRAKVMPLIQSKVLEIVDEIYEKDKYNKDGRFERLREGIHNNFTFSRLLQVFRYVNLDVTEKQNYVDRIVAQLDAIQEQFLTDRLPMYYLTGVDFVRDFFNEKIKYLGPLREEPRSLYPLESNGNTFDLGLKGENTAAVFENNKTKIIKYVNPKYFDEGILSEISPEESTLSEAINNWLVYLGVANKMSTNDKGKMGHELKITTDIKEMEQDLTHVGVGVSQILPILVMCFLAGKGDSIILEQPELHLHPKVQTRLADFFVSMNALGKQCILETHSEYLINRLRYLVAKTNDDAIAKETMIYFVEKEDGHSIYRSITINRYGVIDDWPKGFFDEGEDIATMTMRASMEKRKREIKKK